MQELFLILFFNLGYSECLFFFICSQLIYSLIFPTYLLKCIHSDFRSDNK